MYYYAVLDTNVLVSAMLKADSVPGTVLELALDGNIIPLYNKEILDEYQEVLCRPKFHLPLDIVHTVLQALISRGQNIESVERDRTEFIDPDDAVFYQIVMEYRETQDAYLVTGNLKHFPVKPFVITPKQMLDIIFTEKEDIE